MNGTCIKPIPHSLHVLWGLLDIKTSKIWPKKIKTSDQNILYACSPMCMMFLLSDWVVRGYPIVTVPCVGNYPSPFTDSFSSCSTPKQT